MNRFLLGLGVQSVDASVEKAGHVAEYAEGVGFTRG